MAQITSTHRHDFRWPTADCLVPRAEAPNGKCVPMPPASGPDSNKTWCGRNKPEVPIPGALVAPPRVCYDIAPAYGDSPKPWCERGPLVELLNSRTASAPPHLAPAPIGCQFESAARPWCEGDAPPRPLALKVGAAPQQDTSRYDQPNQFLRQLCDKFPEPVSIITAKPRDELMRRVYADRYRTTYQTDYCRNMDDIAQTVGQCDTHDVNNNMFQPQVWESHGQYQADLMQRQAPGEQHGACKCGCGKADGENELVGGGGGPRIRPLACRPAAVSKNFDFTCCQVKAGKQISENVGPPEKIPPWISEYSDSIGKTGQLVIDLKLLHPKKEKKHGVN